MEPCYSCGIDTELFFTLKMMHLMHNWWPTWLDVQFCPMPHLYKSFCRHWDSNPPTCDSCIPAYDITFLARICISLIYHLAPSVASTLGDLAQVTKTSNITLNLHIQLSRCAMSSLPAMSFQDLLFCHLFVEDFLYLFVGYFQWTHEKTFFPEKNIDPGWACRRISRLA